MLDREITDAQAARIIAKRFPKHLPVFYVAHDGLINGFHKVHKPVTVGTLPASIRGMRQSVGFGNYDLNWNRLYMAETAKVHLTHKAAGLKSKEDEYIIDSTDPKSAERQKLKGLKHGQEILLLEVC